MSAGGVEIQPDWWIALRFWWAFTWRLVVFNAVAGPAFMWVFNRLSGKNDGLDFLLVSVSALVFLGLEIWLMRSLLCKRFGYFRIAVLKVENQTLGQ